MLEEEHGSNERYSSMGMKTASWDFVSYAYSLGLLCSLSPYTAPAYQAPLSFSLHTQMDLWGIQPELWDWQIRTASLLQLYFLRGVCVSQFTAQLEITHCFMKLTKVKNQTTPSAFTWITNSSVVIVHL